MSKEIKKKLHARNTLKLFRVSKNITQEELAEMAGTTQNTISAIEGGQTPSVALAIKLSDVLGVDIRDMFYLI